jgi:hypothetical protein
VIARRWLPVFVIVVLAWLGLAYCTVSSDAHEYQKTAVQSAQAGLSAVRTAALAGQAQRDQRLFPPYLSTVLDDGLSAVAGAQQELLGQPPPDDATRAVRDQLVPLLADAARQIGDLSGASDDEVPALVDRLRRLGDRLDDFVARYQ